MHKKSLLLLVVLALFSSFIFTGCDVTSSTIERPKTMEELVIPKNFTFRTTALYPVNEFLGLDYVGRKVSIYGSVNSASSDIQAIEDVLIGSGTTDEKGELVMDVTVPLRFTHLVFKTIAPDSREILRTSVLFDTQTFVSRALSSKDAGSSLDPEISTTETVTGTIAYEDKWPSLGDYDFNDLVVKYEYDISANKANDIIQIEMTYTLLASGAGYPNGLGLALPMKSTTYTISDLIYSKEGLEPTVAVVEDTLKFSDRILPVFGEDWSRIVIFDLQTSVMGEGIAIPFNTGTGAHVEPQSVSFTLKFSSPISRKTLGVLPYDVFMLVDNKTGYGSEVHFSGISPTVVPYAGPLFDSRYRDNYIFFRSEQGFPWALHIPGTWDHPLERKSIVDAYPRFGRWSEYGGGRHPDWYLDLAGNRNNNYIYDSTLDYSDL